MAYPKRMEFEVRSWERCGNTTFWRVRDRNGDETYLDPLSLRFITVMKNYASLEPGAALIWSSSPQPNVREWFTLDVVRLIMVLPEKAAYLLLNWLTLITEPEGVKKSEAIQYFARGSAESRSTILEGLLLLTEEDSSSTDENRLVVIEGSDAHANLKWNEREAEATEETIVTDDPTFQAGIDTALAAHGITEC